MILYKRPMSSRELWYFALTDNNI